ncbi:MAG: hypothetical protein V1729_04730 [Candidatus Woesearchaeota archaeon]
MGEDLSNKTLAILLGVSIVISLGGLLIFMTQGGEQVTGAAISPVALARINITSRASINWTVYTVDWGTGFVNDTYDYCQMDTEGGYSTPNCSNFTAVYEGLRLVNDGNRKVSVNLSSNVSAADFLGGTGPLFQWRLTNNETNSCGDPGPGATCTPNASLPNYQTYTDVSTAPVEVCPCFFFGNENDTINTELLVRVPSDSYTGVREATLTAVATVI